MINESACHRRRCRHYVGVRYLGEDETSETDCCLAFIRGIPSEIANGNNAHAVGMDGDRGLRFERLTDGETFMSVAAGVGVIERIEREEAANG